MVRRSVLAPADLELPSAIAAQEAPVIDRCHRPVAFLARRLERVPVNCKVIAWWEALN